MHFYAFGIKYFVVAPSVIDVLCYKSKRFIFFLLIDMSNITLYVLAVQVSYSVVAEARYAVYAVDIVYPIIAALFRYKVIAIVYVFS